MSVSRLKDMLAKPDLYHLGPAERLTSLLRMQEVEAAAFPSASSVFTRCGRMTDHTAVKNSGIWQWSSFASNKRILLISADHQECDEIVGIVGRTMKAGGLNHKTWVTRYELPIASQAGGVDLHELGFEAQMHQFYAKSQGDKASLKYKYDRFRELVPFLSQKEAKQKDLDEVRLLEWRLVTQLRDLQVRIADVRKTLEEFENLPLFQRLTMQAVGKNAESLKQYCALYQSQMDQVNKEIDVAKGRIQQLAPEAAVPRGTRAEFEDLKEHVTKLGGTKKVRELLAAEENPNRQAFIQNRRVVAATPTRVASDPLFGRVRFDVLMVDEAPRIAAPSLLAAADSYVNALSSAAIHVRSLLLGMGHGSVGYPYRTVNSSACLTWARKIQDNPAPFRSGKSLRLLKMCSGKAARRAGPEACFCLYVEGNGRLRRPTETFSATEHCRSRGRSGESALKI